MGAQVQVAWGADEHAALCRHVSDGLGDGEIATALNKVFGHQRSSRSVLGRRHRSKLVTATPRAPSLQLTPEVTVEALKLWEGGLSERKIAAAIGASQGLVRRTAVNLGWPKRFVVAQKPAVTPFQLKPMNVASPVLATAPTPVVEEVASSNLPTLRTLGVHMCRWPIGTVAAGYGDEQRFCGSAADGRYCRKHCAIAFRAAA